MPALVEGTATIPTATRMIFQTITVIYMATTAMRVTCNQVKILPAGALAQSLAC